MTKREEALAKMKAYIETDGEYKGCIHIEDAYIIPGSKNFTGVEKRDRTNPKKIVNSEGNRNFSIEITREIAELISNYRLVDHPDKAFKVSVKLPDPNAEDQTERIFMTVKLKYNYDDKGNPWRNNPKIRQYSAKKATEKDETNVHTIDEVFIDKAEIIFAPGPYDVNGYTGLTAWLRKLNYKIKEDDMDSKWDMDYVTDDPTDIPEELPFD